MAETVAYEDGGVELLDRLGPLWQALRDHHADVSAYFGDEIARSTFEARMEQLESKAQAGELRVDVARLGEAWVGYCVCSIDREKRGEIDSLFVRQDAQGRGIGGELMRRALAWLDESGAVNKRLAVAAGNEQVMGFYRKWGFWPREIILQQKPATAPPPPLES